MKIKNIANTIIQFFSKYFLIILLTIFALKMMYNVGFIEGKKSLRAQHKENVRTVSLLSCVRGELNSMEKKFGWDLDAIDCKEFSEQWEEDNAKILKEDL